MSAVFDPISDMLCRINNAISARHPKLDVPASGIKIEIIKIMKDEGFIKNFKIVEDNKQNMIRIYLKYSEDNQSAISRLERISKPSRRMYVGLEDVKPVKNNLGVTILSTPKGIMTNKTAMKERVGGELICVIS